MKLKNEIVFNNAFAVAFSKILTQVFPATVTLQLLETNKVLNEQQKNVFAVRDTLLERLAERTDTSPKFNSSEAEKEFYDEMDKLLSVEFDIPLKEKIKLTDKVQISGEDVLSLLPIIDANI